VNDCCTPQLTLTSSAPRPGPALGPEVHAHAQECELTLGVAVRGEIGRERALGGAAQGLQEVQRQQHGVGHRTLVAGERERGGRDGLRRGGGHDDRLAAQAIGERAAHEGAGHARAGADAEDHAGLAGRRVELAHEEDAEEGQEGEDTGEAERRGRPQGCHARVDVVAHEASQHVHGGVLSAMATMHAMTIVPVSYTVRACFEPTACACCARSRDRGRSRRRRTRCT
jgi:hypothetical protein